MNRLEELKNKMEDDLKEIDKELKKYKKKNFLELDLYNTAHKHQLEMRRIYLKGYLSYFKIF